MRVSACVGAIVFLGGSLYGMEPVPPSKVEDLIQQLGKPDPKTRAAARFALEKVGPEALPILRQAIKHPDVEIRKRVEEIIPGLETALLIAPRLVTLQAEKKTARQLLTLLAEQSGYKIDIWNDDAKALHSLDLKGVPFWKAVDEIGRLSGLNPLNGYSDDRLRFQKENGIPAHIVYDGAFRFTATNLQHSRSLTLPRLGEPGAPPQRSETLTLSYCLHAEPRLPLLGVGEAQILDAVDNEGNSLVPLPEPLGEDEGRRQVQRRVARYGNGYATVSIGGTLQLGKPSPRARGIKELRLSLPVTLLVDQKPEVVVEEVLKAKNKKVTLGTTTFQIESCELTPEKQYRLKMAVTEDKLEANDYTWMNTLYRRVELLDEKGNKYQVVGSSWNHGAPNHVQVTFNYGSPGAAMGPPTRMTYQVWKTTAHSVRIDLKDVPLP